jgi:hypothetical protein
MSIATYRRHNASHICIDFDAVRLFSVAREERGSFHLLQRALSTAKASTSSQDSETF